MECRVFACLAEGLEDRCLFIWLPTNEGNLILEENVSEATFNNFKDKEPFLLWLKGSASKPSAEGEEKDCDGGTVASLNNRNSEAIKEALSKTTPLAIENASDDMSALTTNSFVGEDDAVIAGVAGVPSGGVVGQLLSAGVDEEIESPTLRIFAPMNISVDQGATDRDGEEDITVFTASMPPNILEAEKKLVGFLLPLTDKKSKILTRELIVGGNTVTLQTFHYPATNIVAPRNGKQQTFIDASDMPLVYSYEFKAALTVIVRQVHTNNRF
jgi:hypothetical protein